MSFSARPRRLAIAALIALLPAVTALANETAQPWWKQELRIDSTGRTHTLRNAQSGELIADGIDYFFPENGYAHVIKGNLHGVLGKDGKFILPLAYEAIKSNDEQHVFTVKQHGLWGIVAYDGQWRLPATLSGIDNRNQADEPWVGEKDDKKGLIDPASGNILLPFAYDRIYVNAPFVIATRNDGEQSIDQAFDLRGVAIRNVAPTRFTLKPWDKAGLLIIAGDRVVDAAGNEIVASGHFDSIRPAGRAAIVRRNNRYGLIDQSGKLLTDLRYVTAREITHHDEHARIAVEEALPAGKLSGVLDEAGKIVVPVVWQQIEYKTYRQAAANGQTRGKDGEYYLVSKGGKTGSLDAEGRKIFLPIFDAVFDFDSAHLVHQGKLSGLCEMQRGTCPIPVSYAFLSKIKDTEHLYQAGQSEHAMGVISDTNQIIVPFAYDSISMLPGKGLSTPGDLEAKQHFATTRFRLTHDDQRQWTASRVAGSLIGEQPYDLHPSAQRYKPVIEARFLPANLSSEQQVLAAAQAGRLRDAVFPSIQLDNQTAYVNFAQFVRRKGMAELRPELTICQENDGFRLLIGDQEYGSPCTTGNPTSLRFRGDRKSALVCEDCVKFGLPRDWRRVDPPALKQCEYNSILWELGTAPTEYAEWLGRWQLEAPRWLAPNGSPERQAEGRIDDLARSVAPASRAITTLAILSLDPGRFANMRDPAAPPYDWDLAGKRLMELLATARPAGSGGIYPEQNPHHAQDCAEVWYMHLPQMDTAQGPGTTRFSLPPAGEFVRDAYPFLTFVRSPQGIRLAGISRELLEILFRQTPVAPAETR
jgi:hypothetical protein